MKQLCLGLVLLLACPAMADDPRPIQTDRPTLATAAYTLPSGIVQIETGPQYQSFKGDVDSVFSVPSELRIGLGGHLEFQLLSSVFNSSAALGIGDTTVAMKWNCIQGPHESVTLLPSLTVPTGAGAFRSPADVPGVRLATDFNFTDGGVGCLNIGLQSVPDAVTGHRFTQTSYEIAYSHPISKTLTGFGEFAGLTPDVDLGIHVTLCDAGLCWVPRLDEQFDIALQKGLSIRGLDWGLTVGYSRRWRSK